MVTCISALSAQPFTPCVSRAKPTQVPSKRPVGVLENQVDVDGLHARGRLEVDLGVDGHEQVASPDLKAVAGVVEESAQGRLAIGPIADHQGQPWLRSPLGRRGSGDEQQDERDEEPAHRWRVAHGPRWRGGPP